MSEVRFSLNGREIVLRSTLRAAKEINSRFGSFSKALTCVIDRDLSAYNYVVAAGMGRRVEDVEADVYAQGFLTLSNPIIEYLGLLANGGKPINPEVSQQSDEGTEKGNA